MDLLLHVAGIMLPDQLVDGGSVELATGSVVPERTYPCSARRSTKYLRDPNDRWDMWDATHEFFMKHAPLCSEDARPATLLENIILELPKMLIEIEVTAVIPKK